MKKEAVILKELVHALRYIGFNSRHVMEIYYNYQLVEEEIQLNKLILALKKIGLNWQSIIEDYHDYQFKKNNMSSNDLYDIKSNISNYENRMIVHS